LSKKLHRLLREVESLPGEWHPGTHFDGSNVGARSYAHEYGATVYRSEQFVQVAPVALLQVLFVFVTKTVIVPAEVVPVLYSL
jgi:hypothetical protein